MVFLVNLCARFSLSVRKLSFFWAGAGWVAPQTRPPRPPSQKRKPGHVKGPHGRRHARGVLSPRQKAPTEADAPLLSRAACPPQVLTSHPLPRDCDGGERATAGNSPPRPLEGAFDPCDFGLGLNSIPSSACCPRTSSLPGDFWWVSLRILGRINFGFSFREIRAL